MPSGWRLSRVGNGTPPSGPHVNEPMMNVFILLISLGVYATYGLPGLAYLTAATLLSYGIGLLTNRFRWMMWIPVAANALMLVLLKLRPVTGMELLAPMGVSYFSTKLECTRFLHIISIRLQLMGHKTRL